MGILAASNTSLSSRFDYIRTCMFLGPGIKSKLRGINFNSKGLSSLEVNVHSEMPSGVARNSCRRRLR